MINRRGAMQALGMGALTAPAITRGIASSASGEKYGALGGIGQGVASQGVNHIQPPWERARLAFANKDAIEAVRSSLFEQHRHITVLDTDLATKRSFSLAAKIAYQRQRNVARELDCMTKDSWSSHVWGIIEKFVK